MRVNDSVAIKLCSRMCSLYRVAGAYNLLFLNQLLARSVIVSAEVGRLLTDISDWLKLSKLDGQEVPTTQKGALRGMSKLLADVGSQIEDIMPEQALHSGESLEIFAEVRDHMPVVAKLLEQSLKRSMLWEIVKAIYHSELDLCFRYFAQYKLPINLEYPRARLEHSVQVVWIFNLIHRIWSLKCFQI